ncbi:flagellar hook assembly protein FlgD [Caldimonas brevitalea]|uniref:Basal-body rod modification protein FlgD n=1 Tax=Caldimonas brevitalea TaxID=413882 RepID=A0A0G3BNE7_9BURK|nr:flagellar hook assembly protein FlgD [Caldimonas brevitalea]AKJ30974.1 flagellar hook capping protein FlgD [Caldimonas brevitalea]
MTTTSVSNSATTSSKLNELYAGSAVDSSKDPSAQDRFLKLLVTQMQNQDPLNPMDNAQVTSQMAQIQTVSGIEKLNTSLGTMSTSFLQGQAMQGASLIGRDVLVAGSSMAINEGQGRAAFELDGKADKVTVEITGAAGQVLDTISLGGLEAGRHHFAWKTEDGTPPESVNFRVTASSGASAVAATTYSRETVGAVSTTANGLELDLANGTTVSYGKVAGVLNP